MSKSKLLADLDFLHQLLLDFDIIRVSEVAGIFEYECDLGGLGYSFDTDFGDTKLGMSCGYHSKFIRFWDFSIIREENLIHFNREKLHDMEYIESAMRALRALYN